MSTGGGFIAGSIIGKLLLDKTGWDSSVSGVGKDTEKLKDNAKSIGEKFEQAGAKIQAAGIAMTIFGGAVTAAVGVSVRAYGDFDSAMNQSLAIMDDISGEMKERMIQAARDVGRETSISAETAAGAYFYLASAGYTADEQIKLLPVTAKFAQAGMFDLESATSMLADAQSALGMRIRDDAVANMENMIRVSDVLSKANIMSNATIEEFADALTNRAGAALRLVGKDIEEGAAVLSAFAETGIKGAEAGTRLDIVLRDLQTRAINNKGAFEKYNVAVFDSNGEMRNMADIIADLERAMAGQSDEKKRQILMEMEFQDRSVASILALVGMAAGIRDYEAGLRTAAGTTDAITKKQLEAFNEKWKQTKNNLHEVTVELGASLGPALYQLFDPIQKVARQLADFIRDHQEAAVLIMGLAGAFGAVVTVVGGGLVIVGTFLRSIGSIEKVLPGFTGKLTGVAAAAGKVFLAFAAWKAGWNLGRVIGELTGLDKVYQNCFESAYDFLGIANGMNVEWAEGHTAAEAKRTEVFAAALELTGKKAGTLREAVDLLTPIYLQMGTTGSAAADKIVKSHLDLLKTTDDVKKGTENLGGGVFDLSAALEGLGLKTKTALTVELKNAESALSALRGSTEKTPGAVKALEEKVADLRETLYGSAGAADAAKKAQEEYASFLSSIGIFTQQDMERATRLVYTAESDVQKLYEQGKITGENYAGVIKNLSEYAAKHGLIIATKVLPEERKLGDLWNEAPAQLQDVYGGYNTLDGAMTDVANTIRMSTATVQIMTYEWTRLALALRGIVLPDMRIPGETKAAVKQDTDDLKGYWDGLFNDVSQSWGDVIDGFISGETSIVTTWNRMFKTLRDTVLDFVGKTITEKLIKGIQSIVAPTETATEEAAGAFSSMGSSVGSVVSGIGSSIVGLATSIASIITTLATGIATAIVTIATAVATAITTLAATAPALLELGLVAAAIYTAFKLGQSLVEGIGNLIGGGGDNSDITYWLDAINKTIIEYGIANGQHIIQIKDQRFGEVKETIDNLANSMNLTRDVIQNKFEKWGEKIVHGLDVVAEKVMVVASTIAKLSGAAAGATSYKTQLMMVHGSQSNPEHVIPHSDLGRFVAGLAPRQDSAAATSTAAPVVQIQPILIDKGDKWMIKFIQKHVVHGDLQLA